MCLYLEGNTFLPSLSHLGSWERFWELGIFSKRIIICPVFFSKSLSNTFHSAKNEKKKSLRFFLFFSFLHYALAFPVFFEEISIASECYLQHKKQFYFIYSLDLLKFLHEKMKVTWVRFHMFQLYFATLKVDPKTAKVIIFVIDLRYNVTLKYDCTLLKWVYS